MNDNYKLEVEKIRQEAEKTYDKIILTLTSGCLFLSFKCLENQSEIIQCKTLLILSQCVFALVLIVNLYSFRIAIKAGFELNKGNSAKGGSLDKRTKMMNCICYYGFIIGLILFLLQYIMRIL